MVQLSSFSIWPNTSSLSTFPDLTVKTTLKSPVKVDPAQQPPGNPQWGLQVNLMGLQGWSQFVLVSTGPADSPPSSICYGVDIMPTVVQNQGIQYVVIQPYPTGTVFPGTTIDPAKYNNGDYYVLFRLANMLADVQVRSQADDSLVWSTGSLQFPTFHFDQAHLPSILGVEAVGKWGRYNTRFIEFEATVEVSSSAQLAGKMQPDPAVWTYDDGVNGRYPLFWANETGESSDLWTNVLSQTPNDVLAELSLTEGNQLFSNPPLGAKDTVLTLKASG